MHTYTNETHQVVKSVHLDELLVFMFVSVFHIFLHCFVLFQDKGYLCSPGCPGIPSVDQAGLKPRTPPASVSQGLRLKVRASTSNFLLALSYDKKSNDHSDQCPQHTIYQEG